MNDVRQRNIWAPIFYTLVWMIGFFIGIFGFMEDAEGPMKLVVGAFTTYCIFLMNAFLDFWIILVRNLNLDIKPAIAYVLFGLCLMVIVSIILSYFFVHSGSDLLFMIVAVIMIISFFGMEWIKANDSYCFVEAKGKQYTGNL
ncbi:MAG: hypothetical protein HDS94_04355 [Bacteroidales bacterium]|nr:hypothetical protein [Bacteroidales bacterium]